MPDSINLLLSITAIVISGITAWLTLFHGGKVRMTRPSLIFFGPDGLRNKNIGRKKKIYIRSFLYCTSQRGRIVNNLYAVLSKDGVEIVFPTWIHGADRKHRGCGVFVGRDGVASDHHFVIENTDKFKISAGKYELKIMGEVVGSKRQVCFSCTHLEIPEDHSLVMLDPSIGVFFDYQPAKSDYSFSWESPDQMILRDIPQADH